MAAKLSFDPSKKHSDVERWVCIYPAYINSKKSRAEGRRVPKNNCVENPTPQEIRDVLQAAGLRLGVENKQYSRERSKEYIFIGRIRVQIKNDDGSLCKQEFPSRQSLFMHLGEMIPKLKTRQGNRSGEQAPHHQVPSQSAPKAKGKKGRR